MDDFIWVFVWSFLWDHALQTAQIVGGAVVCLIFVLMCFAQAGNLYDRIQEECNLEKLLDTPQKENDTKMEGNTTYCYPGDEGPFTKICPLCGALYSDYASLCIYDKEVLQQKPITEPLPILQSTITQAIAQIDSLQAPESTIGMDEVAERAAEKELQEKWTALENRAYLYDRSRPYTFSREEVLKICALELRWNSTKHQERRAS